MRPHLTAALGVALVACASVARAQSDPCSWITPAQLTQEYSGPFKPPQQTTAPPAYEGQNPGTSCLYVGHSTIRLTVYVDRSVAEAKTTWDRLLETYFKVESKASGLGDDAFYDRHLYLQIFKGMTRVSIETGISSDTAKAHHYGRDLAMLVLPHM